MTRGPLPVLGDVLAILDVLPWLAVVGLVVALVSGRGCDAQEREPAPCGCEALRG